MTKREIKYWEEQLDKYFEGKTTRKEEQELQKYFTGSNVDKHLVKYKPLFMYFSREKEEVYSKEIPYFTKRRQGNIKKWLSVAAGALLLFSAYTGIRHYREKQEARRAYENTIYAFRLIAKNLKTGRKNIGKLKAFEQTKNKIFKTQNQ
jgi:hypothetical protein